MAETVAFLRDPDLTLYCGDCLAVLAGLPDGSVDAVVTDPPYGINFMGKAWDGTAIETAAQAARDSRRPMPPRLTGSPDNEAVRKLTPRSGSAFANRAGEAGAYDFSPKGNHAFQAWCEAWGSECLRVLKPGGHALVFGGTRTYHRLASGLEDAGFEIRDCVAWMFGSGFPKSLDVAKAIDKSQGVEWSEFTPNPAERPGNGVGAETSTGWVKPVVESDDAKDWQGWGTALKPAFEPILVARKPLTGTVAENVLAHGTGALNVNGCRIGWGASGDASAKRRDAGYSDAAKKALGSVVASESATGFSGEVLGADSSAGRWPANVVLNEEAAAALDAQTGVLTSGTGAVKRATSAGWQGSAFGVESHEPGTPNIEYGDSGGASRFFYCAKVSRAERNAGLESFAARPLLWSSGEQSPGTFQGDGTDRSARNNHPTVKPIALMRWLVRLVTPPGGTVLDPFLGSGTTGIAAALEGFRFIGVERESDYMAIAEARIRFWREHGEDGLRIVAKQDAAAQDREARADLGQLSFLA